MKPSLFGPAYSAYVRVARLALIEKGVEYDLIPVDVFEDESKTAFLDRHPFGKVPAFEHGSFRLYETAAICRYIDAAFDGTPLQPTNAQAVGLMAQVIGITDAYLYRSLVWNVYVEEIVIPRHGGDTDDATVTQGKTLSKTALGALSSILGDYPFLAGDTYSLADCHLAPMLAYGRDCPSGKVLVEAEPSLNAWLDRMTSRPSWTHAIAEG